MSVLFAAYAVAHAGTAAWFFSRGSLRPPPYTLLFVIGVGLCYDNMILALGSILGEGPLLVWLSYPRHVSHVLLTPMLPIIATCIAGDSGLKALQTRGARSAAWAASFAVLGWAYVEHMHGLSLRPVWDGGLLMYGSAKRQAPYFVIFATVIVLGVGIALWRATGIARLAAGAFLMLGAGGLQPVLGSWITNLGEVIFMVSLVSCAVVARPGGVAAPPVGSASVANTS